MSYLTLEHFYSTGSSSRETNSNCQYNSSNWFLAQCVIITAVSFSPVFCLCFDSSLWDSCLLEVFQTRPTGQRPQGRRRAHLRENICKLLYVAYASDSCWLSWQTCRGGTCGLSCLTCDHCDEALDKQQNLLDGWTDLFTASSPSPHSILQARRIDVSVC